MTWTSARPTVPGWYWFKDSAGIRFMTVILETGAFSDDVLWASGMTKKGSLSSATIDRWEGHWAGPLEPPEEG